LKVGIYIFFLFFFNFDFASLNYFLLLFLRATPNQLGLDLKVGPYGDKVPQAAKASHSTLACQNQCSRSSLFSPQELY